MMELELVKLWPLMAGTSGPLEVAIGLIDGPIARARPDLEGQNIRELGVDGVSCSRLNSAACRHGSFVTGMLFAKRGSRAPAICPGCGLVVRSVFLETIAGNERLPCATPEELAAAIVETIDADARILSLSASSLSLSSKGERDLQRDYAAQRGVITVAAAGNESVVGSSSITRYPWVIPVAGCNLQGRPMGQTKLGNSIGRAGSPRARGGDHEPWAGRRADHLRRHQRTYGVYYRKPGFAPVGISTRAQRIAVIGSGKRTKFKPKNDCAAAAWTAYHSDTDATGDSEKSCSRPWAATNPNSLNPPYPSKN